MKKRTHLKTVQISINNKRCTFVCDCTLTFSTVVCFNELFCRSENGSTGGFWAPLWRRWDRLKDAELASVHLSNILWCYSELFCCQSKLNPLEWQSENWLEEFFANSTIQIQMSGHEIERKSKLIPNVLEWPNQSPCFFFFSTKAATQENAMIQGFNPKAKL